MFRGSSAHLQEDTVVYMQHKVLSLCKQVSGRVLLKHDNILWINNNQCIKFVIIYRSSKSFVATLHNSECVQFFFKLSMSSIGATTHIFCYSSQVSKCLTFRIAEAEFSTSPLWTETPKVGGITTGRRHKSIAEWLTWPGVLILLPFFPTVKVYRKLRNPQTRKFMGANWCSWLSDGTET